jgi:trans-aconitate methyltransferase
MNLLASVHEEATASLLDRVGVPSGARCVEFGCGGGHVVLELARRVGPHAVVDGVDLDAELLDVAREMASDRASAMSPSKLSPPKASREATSICVIRVCWYTSEIPRLQSGE